MTTYYMTPRARRRIRRSPTSDQIARYVNHKCDVNIPLDIKDEEDAFVIYATVPGLDVEDLNIEIIKNVVEIRGEFNREESEEEDNYLRRERPTGEFRRRLRFATKLESDQAEASLDNGILTLRIPKVPEEQPKKIEVKTK